MGRPPEPETIDVEPPRDPIRPDRGYRVGARIGPGDAGRARLAGSIAVGVVLAGIAFAAVGPLLPAVPELVIAPAPTRSVPTPLPAVTALRMPVTTRAIPVYAGGLRWLDPTTGAISGDPYTSPRGNLFVDAEGRGLCVCLEIPWSQDRFVARVTLRRFSATGGELARTTLSVLESAKGLVSGEPIQVAAAISPDGRQLWIAHAVRADPAWQIGVDRVDLATLRVEASLDLDPVPVPSSDDAGVLESPSGWVTHRRSMVRASLRISPGGDRLAVLLVAFGRPGLDARLPPFQEARLVVDANLAPGSRVEVADRPHNAVDDPCDAELSGWATDRQFLTICRRPEGGGVQPFVRVEGPGDLAQEVAVGPPVGEWDAEWLLDARHGVLYRWSTLAHVFTRFDVVTLDTSSVAIDIASYGTDEAPADPTTWPEGPVGEWPWSSLTGADGLRNKARLAGSADGAVIYAIGFRSVPDDLWDDRIGSTGIWALDSRGGVLAHWVPTALYDQIGFTPGQERLVTVALPGSNGDGEPADWSTSLRLHDPRSGEVDLILGDVQEPSGFVPALLPSNLPGDIAGL
jgi:hypothetical protein